MKQYRYWIGILAATLLGMIFAVAGMGKLMAGSSSYEAFLFPSFLPEVITDAAYAGIPYVEVMVGLVLICGIAVKFTTSISAILIASFITSNLYLLNIGVGTCGNCFGVAGGLTVYAALVLDGLMAVLAVIIFFSHKGAYFNKTPWFLTGRTVTQCA